MEKRKRIFRKLLWMLVLMFVLMNLVANFHAYKFTHFAENGREKTRIPEKLSLFEKLGTLIVGISNPRPANNAVPTGDFETVKIKSNVEIECWYVRRDGVARKGTVIIFHGYAGQKSSMLDKSDEFLKLGYRTLLVDFMGSGGSEGNITTLGFKEAEEVKSAYDYVRNSGEKDIYLFGTSMGAAAILKAINDYDLKPKGIMIECPFGSMYQTTCARFKIMKAPVFPMAGLLVFWGGVQNGFWAMGHNPSDYAKRVNCPTLLLYGEQDKNVSRQEIDAIYTNLAGEKRLKLYHFAGHENYLIKYKGQWIRDITEFMNSI